MNSELLIWAIIPTAVVLVSLLVLGWVGLWLARRVWGYIVNDPPPKK